MIQGHRTYLDNPRLVTTHARKPPLARFHRRWMDAQGIEARRAAIVQQSAVHESPVPKECAQ